ncbi:MAG: sulfatase-like hydrolase/transferase, partial [Limisphaerales bacterium]
MVRIFVCCAVVALLPHPAIAAGPAERLNLLFLFSDDQRADTIHALGNPHIQTPNLDRLVDSGTVFTRAYCMGGMQPAVCVPARAMLMSGRTLFRVRENLEGQTTWPEMFARSGYETFITGKWHNQAPALLRSFESGRAVFLGGMGNPYSLPVQDITPSHQLANKRPTGRHAAEVFADSAIDFLKTRPRDRPFLLYVAFNSPHDPRLAPKEYHERYNAAKPPAPPDFLPVHPFNNGEMTIRDEQLAPWPRTPEVIRQHLADYYAAITFMDRQVGRILEALKESGDYDHTIIVFSSDQGLAIGSHGLMGKQNLYESSMRVPLILAGPGIPRKQRADALCYLSDIFPTLGELTGVAAPEGSEGRSLAPVIAGRTRAVRDSIFLAYRQFQRAVRDDRWKLIVYPHINKVQLFDLRNDPFELNDRSGDPARAGEIQRLTARLQELQNQLGDQQPLRTANPQPIEFDFR